MLLGASSCQTKSSCASLSLLLSANSAARQAKERELARQLKIIEEKQLLAQRQQQDTAAAAAAEAQARAKEQALRKKEQDIAAMRAAIAAAVKKAKSTGVALTHTRCVRHALLNESLCSAQHRATQPRH
jgi:pyruvate/2-oxoglutarate dehydrogenase complex dihydrolipoamide acyltransferase (E2) component